MSSAVAYAITFPEIGPRGVGLIAQWTPYIAFPPSQAGESNISCWVFHKGI